MLTIPTTRAQQARQYLRIRTSFGLSDQNPNNSIDAASAALSEAVSYYSNGVEHTLAEIFTLAEAVLAHRDDVAEAAPAIYDLASLTRAFGSSALALIAIKLCGAYIQNPSRWQDDGLGRPVPVSFPPTFFTDYVNDWGKRA